MLLLQLLRRRKVFELCEINHVDGLDCQDNASPGIILNSCEVAILFFIKTKVSVDHLEGSTRHVFGVESSSNGLIKFAPFITRQIPRGRVLDNCFCLVSDNIEGVVLSSQVDQLGEGERFDASVGVHAIVELNQAIDLNFK